MANIQIYQGNRVKDGKPVRGYAAQGSECGKVFVMVPAGEASFHVFEVEEGSLVPVMYGGERRTAALMRRELRRWDAERGCGEGEGMMR